MEIDILFPVMPKEDLLGQSIVEANGNFYICDFYVNEGNKLENIENSSIKSIFQSKKISESAEESSPLHPECKTCSVYNLCRNGCK